MAAPTEEQIKQLEAQLSQVSDALTEYKKLSAKLSTGGTAKATGPIPPKEVGATPKPQPQRPTKEEVDSAWDKFSAASDSFAKQLSGVGMGTPTPGTGRPMETADSPDLRTSFSSFIQSVGTSLSKAQDSLDSQARESFKASAGAGGPLLPTLYRIPKLSAEVKFAFDKTTEKGLNLLFFSKKDQASEAHQQSIAFDIVATPPPPELLERLKRDIPTLQLVLAPSVREEVLDAIQRFRQSQKEQGKTAATALEELELNFLPKSNSADSTKDRLVIIEVPDPTTRRYLVFAAGKSSSPDRAHEVGAWHVELKDPEKPGIQAVLRYSSEGESGENQGFLREFILGVGDRQAKFLAGLRLA
jgi:hypothetical protein